MLAAPLAVYVPDELYAGYRAEISWDPVNGAHGYVLQRRFDRAFDDFTPGATWSDIEAMDFTWEQFDAADLTWDELEQYAPDYEVTIYTGPNTEYTDTMAETAGHVAYRVRVYTEHDLTWEEFEEKDLNWAELDALEWSWESDTSEWTTTGLYPIIANRPPTINGYDSSLGLYYSEFPVRYTVYDPDPENAVNVVVAVNGSIKDTHQNIVLGREYTTTIDARQYTYNATHTIVITATDNKGASSRRVYTFKTLSVTYYIVRDGIRIAKPLNVLEYYDYMAVGVHRYYISAIDADEVEVKSNEVTIDVKIQYATLAKVDDPANYAVMMLREGQPPQTSLNESNIYEEKRFIGLRDPKFIDTKQRSRSINVTYTAIDYEQYQQISEILNSGVPIIYRDHFKNRIIGVSENNPFDFVKELNHQQYKLIVDYSFTIMQTAYDEEVSYD